MLQYAQDFDESLPPGTYCDSPNLASPANSCTAATAPTRKLWSDVIQPYMKTFANATYAASASVGPSILVCPSFPTPNQNSQYGIHPWLCQDFGSNNSGAIQYMRPAAAQAVTLAQLDSPASLALVEEKGDAGLDAPGGKPSRSAPYFFLADETYNIVSRANPTPPASVAPFMDCDARTYQNPATGNCALFARFRHTRVTNVLLADGHVKIYAKGRLSWLETAYASGLMPPAY